MTSSGMLRRVALGRTDVTEDLTASFIRVTRICELGTTLLVTSNYLVVYVTYIVLTLPPGGQPICSSVIIIITIIIIM
jgi:hypothetical protein